MKLTFIGATQSVTGSMTLVREGETLLLVDAGLYQGLDAEEKLLIPLPFNPKDLSAVVITHAHLDHCGMLPRLFKLGFKGQVFCTEITAKLMRLILTDSAHLLEEKENPQLQQFYDLKNVEQVFGSLHKLNLHHAHQFENLKITLRDAGHILGATSLLLEGSKRVLFSGDLGRSDDLLLNPPEKALPDVDLIVMESTYGDRLRPQGMEAELASFLVKIKNTSRTGLIASFAVARAQNLLYMMHQFYTRHPEYKVPVYVDGPMLQAANDIYKKYAHVTRDVQGLKHALGEFEMIDHFKVRQHIQNKDGPQIILASSGMLSGGPVMSYLEHFMRDETVSLLLSGYQAQGTLGRALVEHQKNLTINHKPFEWRGEIEQAETFSSHADQAELLSWLADNSHSPVALIHGEESAKLKLQSLLKDRKCFIPSTLETRDV
jgi:metallo-beta-lactamase family protein